MQSDQLLGVEVRHLAALSAISRTRSFSRAADELGYAQSAISQQIAALERAVGHKLVERPGGPRPVSLTEAGLLLLGHAERITARLSAARADLDALAAGEAGALRIGTFQSASARLLPQVITRFRERWPRVLFELHGETNSPDLDSLVVSGAVDLAFSILDNVRPPLIGVELFTDPYVVLVPPDSPFARCATIGFADLDGLGMIAPAATDACAISVKTELKKARSSPRVVFRTDDNLTSQRLVATGLGCAIVPLLTVETNISDAAAVVVPLRAEDAFDRRVGLIWHRDRYRSRAAEAFVEIAREVCDELAGGFSPLALPTPLIPSSLPAPVGV